MSWSVKFSTPIEISYDMEFYFIADIKSFYYGWVCPNIGLPNRDRMKCVALYPNLPSSTERLGNVCSSKWRKKQTIENVIRREAKWLLTLENSGPQRTELMPNWSKYAMRFTYSCYTWHMLLIHFQTTSWNQKSYNWCCGWCMLMEASSTRGTPFARSQTKRGTLYRRRWRNSRIACKNRNQSIRTSGSSQGT